MRGRPADRAQRIQASVQARTLYGVLPIGPATAKTAVHREEVIAKLAAITSTEDIETLTRIIMAGTPLWMIEQLAAVANNTAHRTHQGPAKEQA